jgi:type VI secretion system secreted protein VgrG
MPKYTQDTRRLKVTTPLGKDQLLLIGLSANEAISHLFSFRVDTIAENATEVAFDRLLGQPVTVEITEPQRFFNGICVRVSQGERDQTFTAYSMEIVPKFWLLTRKAQSRIFQQISVPNILKKVFADLDVKYQLEGQYEPRDYCVQYRETDFNFASRLMEEEGLFYYFQHKDGSHTMIVTDSTTHPDLPNGAKLVYEEISGGHRKENRIFDWAKTQEMRSGKYTLWDHCFELPHKHVEADKTIQSSVQAGTVEHKLKVGGNDNLELYDFPGEYAQRFDGVDPGGGDRPGDVQKIFEDNKRTVALRMQQEAFPSLKMQGRSTCHQVVAGYQFTLDRHFNADGKYLVTNVNHRATLAAYRSDHEEFLYENSFLCTPVALPFRPARVTPRPFVQGSQTAVVVGPSGEEIFTDKYGRVKVQFHWDREGKHDVNSSCWIRVATHWAGKRWGAFHIPRIGQEVVVDFLEGDPDQPIIVGSVYNAEQMHPYLGDGPDPKHPKDPKVSGIKSCSTKGGAGFNEIRFDDTKDKEQIFIHGQRDEDIRILKDSREFIGHDRHQIIGKGKYGPGDQRVLVEKDKHLTIKKDHIEKIGGNMELLVEGTQDVAVNGAKKETIGGDLHIHAKLNRNEKVDVNQSLTVGANQSEKVGAVHALDAGATIHLKAGVTCVIEAGVQLTLKVGGNFVDINPGGVFIQGTMVLINSGGAAGAGPGSNPTAAADAKKAAPKEPDVADDAVPGNPSTPAHH